jgi:Tol biopolymer transport system component
MTHAQHRHTLRPSRDRRTPLSRPWRGRVAALAAASAAITASAPLPVYADGPPRVEAGLIAFQSNDGLNDDDAYQVFVMRPDGTGLRQVTHLPHNSALRPDISLDGRRIVFSRGTPTFGDPLFTIDVDGSHLKQITHDPANNYHDANFSPDGRRIAAERYPTDGSAVSQVVVMNADGFGLNQITHDPTMFSIGAKWSPDWRRLAVCSGPADFSKSAVFTIKPDGTDRQRVTPWRLDGCGSSWAPDGRHIVFGSNGFEPQFGLLYIVDTNTGVVRRITDLPAGYPGFGDFDPAWSPQGDRIAFASDRNGCCDIWVVHLDTGRLSDLTPGNPPYDAVTSWSAKAS